MIVDEVYAKTILSKSKVLDYSTNPYIGCMHGLNNPLAGKNATVTIEVLAVE
jgi:hypothetical protein